MLITTSSAAIRRPFQFGVHTFVQRDEQWLLQLVWRTGGVDPDESQRPDLQAVGVQPGRVGQDGSGGGATEFFSALALSSASRPCSQSISASAIPAAASGCTS